jgi:two-component system OmpR family sensor kinase
MTAAGTGRRPRTLAGRIVAMAILVALASVVVTGIAMIGLFHAGATKAGQASLARDADTVAASLADIADRRTLRQQRLRTQALNKLLTSRQITLATVGAQDQPTALAAPFTLGDLQAVRQTGTLSTRRDALNESWLIEGRLSGDSDVLLAQPENQALAESRLGLGRLAVPLVLGLLGGGLAGLVLAGQITAPLRRLAAAAGRLSGGDREIRVLNQGPREVVEVAQSMNDLAAALAASEARQRRFLMNVSHELRTPLTAVTGYAEGLADGVLSGPEAQAAGAVILAEAARLDRRVDDLLALARMEADDFHLEPAPTDLGELLKAAARAWQQRAGTAGITLQVAAPAQPLVVSTDGERLRQAIDALADNALRVLSPGHTLTFGCGQDDSRAWIEVEDDGPGLAEEDLAIAFDRGRLTERYRGSRPVGSGLGLALVGELGHRLGGQAFALPGARGGVRFVVTLPLPASSRPTQPLPTRPR